MSERKLYPDISDILARKERGRRARAKLSFGEKLDLVDRLRADAAPLIATRRARLAERSRSSGH